MNSDSNDDLPKYACSQCGHNEVRGDFDTCPVFRQKAIR